MQKPAASACSQFPEWALLDTIARSGCCKGATAAATKTSTGHHIEVSFVVADPPALTRCVVHCPELTADNFLEVPPCVTGADGAFVLIRVNFPRRDGRSRSWDAFIYKAGPGKPSLQILPRPYPVGLPSNNVGVLSCGDDHCLVVVPVRRFDADCQIHYDLHVFSDKAGSWSTKAARLACDAEEFYGDFEPTKVFSVEGDSLAWVDLRNGILLCNSILEDPEVRLIKLPHLMHTNKDKFHACFDGLLPPLDLIRDVTFRNGCFRFIEMEYPEIDDDDDNTELNFRWTATMLKRMIGSEEWEPEPVCTVDSADLLPADSCLPYLFPEIWDCKDNKLTLNNVMSSGPTLDMYHDDVVYMMTKVNADDKNGWVFAVNTKIKELVKVSPFSAERLYGEHMYMQCSFSNHLRKVKGTHMASDLNKRTNREKIALVDTYLLDALNQLRNIETHMEYLNKRYNGSTSFVFSGPGSYLDQSIRTEAEYGLNNGRGKDVAHAGAKCSRLVGDIELQISAPIDALKSTIRVAHGALYNLMGTLPSSVLDQDIVELEEPK